MFWDSVVAGLNVLTYWEAYAAGLEYIAIVLVPRFVMGSIMEKGERAGAVVGCMSMIVLPILQVLAMTVFVFTLAPIILGMNDDAAWSFPWTAMFAAPEAFFKMVGMLVVAAIVLSFIPLLGQLHSLQTLILGGIALMFVLGILEYFAPGTVDRNVDFVPGFWFSAGLLAVGGIMSWIGMMAAALLVALVARNDESVGMLVMASVGGIFGFIPVFMYGAWLGSQVKGGF